MKVRACITISGNADLSGESVEREDEKWKRGNGIRCLGSVSKISSTKRDQVWPG